MEVLFFLIPVSLMMALVGLISYGWAVRSGQFEDLDNPARDIIIKEDHVQ